MLGNIASFESMGLVDGPGVRFVVFMQGCPLRCAFCHNPEMWNSAEYKIQMTPEELFAKIKRYKPYFGETGGVTISGGEPLLQVDFVAEVFKLCRKDGIHTCLDTSGCGENFEIVLEYCDLVILDIKDIDEDRYTNLVGAKMDKFKNFLEACQKKHIKMWFRQVIMPGYNDTTESVLALKKFANSFENVEKIELLPYHTMAKDKYKKLRINYRLENMPEMDKMRCKELEKLLKD